MIIETSLADTEDRQDRCHHSRFEFESHSAFNLSKVVMLMRSSDHYSDFLTRILFFELKKTIFKQLYPIAYIYLFYHLLGLQFFAVFLILIAMVGYGC